MPQVRVTNPKRQGEAMKEHGYFSLKQLPAHFVPGALLAMVLCLATFSVATSAQDQGRHDTDRRDLIRAEQPPPPCTPNETAAQDVATVARRGRSEEHTSELQSRRDLVCRLLLEKKKKKKQEKISEKKKKKKKNSR